MSRLARIAGLAGATAAVAAVIPAAAPAAVGRPFTVTTSAEQFPNGFSGAVNASGTAAFAWTRPHDVRFRIRSAAGRLGSPVTVSRSRRAAFTPQVAIDPRGDTLVVWHEKTGESTHRLLVARRPRGGRFGAPQVLGQSLRPVDGTEGAYPLVAFGPRGDALVAWRYPDSRVALAWARPRGIFDRAQRLRGLAPLSIAFRSDGTAAVPLFKFRGQVAEAVAAPRGRFALAGTAFALTPSPAGIADVTASEAPDGTALIAWREGYAGDPGAGADPGPVHASTRDGGGAFAAEEVISQPQLCGGVAANSAIRVSGAVSSTGQALVTWQTCTGDPSDPGARSLFARQHQPLGGWRAPVALGPHSISGGPAGLAPGGQGDVGMTWLAGDRDIAVATVLPGGAITEATHLRSARDARRTGPRIAAAGDRLLVVWGSGDGYQAAVGQTGG